MSVSKLTKAGTIIWGVLMNSEHLEDLQRAETQDDFEEAITEITYEIVEALAECEMELNYADGLRYRKQLLEHQISENTKQLDDLIQQMKDQGLDV